MSTVTLVLVLRIISVFAFVGPMLLWRGESNGRQRAAGARLPVIANFGAVGLFYGALLMFAGSLAGQRALHLATLGALLALAAGALVRRSRIELGAAWSLVPKAHQSTGLVATGPYRLIRHPIYAGFVLLAIGQALAFDSMPAVAIALFGILPTFIWRARVEEELLRRTFGEQYDRYRTQTKMLIPFIL